MPKGKKQPALKIALVHDFLREYGGAERVVEALHELYPEAPLYVAFADPASMGMHWQRFESWDIRQSWLSRVPFVHRLFSPLRVLAPAAFRHFDLSEYDVVISSSNAYFAKAVQVQSPSKHLCYCHTPPRALYGYSTMSDWKKNPAIRIAGTLINHICRIMDAQSTKGVDLFIANSGEVQRRIQKYYRRDSVIIHPPVLVPATLEKNTQQDARSYYLYVNRLAFAKHPELAVQVATELELPLKVVGSGKMLAELQEIAGPTVEFLGSVSDEQLHTLYGGAKALLYPVEDEDFGMVPIEAMGHGVPIVAHRSGGPMETIIEGETGVFFDDLSSAGLSAAVQKLQSLSLNPASIHQHAQQFSERIFRDKVRELVERTRATA